MKKLLFMLLCIALLAGCNKNGEEKVKKSTATDTEKPAESEKTPSSKDFVEMVSDLGMKMIFVEGGTFLMGATAGQGDDAYDNEYPVREITLDFFYIGECEVTQSQWYKIMNSDPSYYKGEDLPVDNVSWNEAQEFCERLSELTGKKYALPTEAQWEYSARGGKRGTDCKYSGSNDLDEVGWYAEDSGYGTNPVKMKQPNELGLYDMSGNVWEWCQDWYADRYDESDTTNPAGPSMGQERVLRGGSAADNAYNCRISARFSYPPGDTRSDSGFRIVMIPVTDDSGDMNGDGNAESGTSDETAKAFPDPIFRAYVLANFDIDGDGKISKEEAEAVSKIDVDKDYYTPDDEKIASLEGLQYFTGLTELSCTYNKLTDLDLSQNTALRSLTCQFNQLTDLYVGGCGALETMKCYENRLTSLDLTRNPALKTLDCNANRLTELDVTANPALTGLVCYSNSLTTLNVSRSFALETLQCYYNDLAELDLTQCSSLTELFCSYNRLTTLDVSNTDLDNSSSWYPLRCSPMNGSGLEVLYLKAGWDIPGVYPVRNSNYVPANTDIRLKD